MNSKKKGHHVAKYREMAEKIGILFYEENLRIVSITTWISHSRERWKFAKV